MMRALFLSLLLALTSAPVFAIDITQFDDPAKQEQYLKLTHELRCMQCLNTSIADSQVDLAADLRREVHDLVLQGKTDDEIRKYMVDRYGEFILFRPLTNGRNMWLWLSPIAFVLFGVVVAVRILRQRSKLVDQDHEPIEGDTGR